MPEYKAAIFDLDDTLLKTAEIKWAHHKAVAKKFYGIELTDDVLAEHWGKPFNELVGHLYEHSDSVENMLAANRSIEADFPKGIQSDTMDALNHLSSKGILLGILTSINTDYALNDLAIVHVPTDYFSFVLGADATKHHKPDKRAFDEALALLGQHDIRPKETVYVGDALIDFQAARDAKLGFVGVATGFVAIEAFKQAGAIAVPNLSEAAQLIAA